MNLLLVFLILLAVRLSSIFIVKTYYVPDEYWQSLEVAHKLTFGYGYLTWEWVQGIRSYIYPLFIAGIYKLLALFNLDTTHMLVVLPRVFQATLSAYSDYRFFIWSGKKKWALFLITVSWFWFYIGSRTLSNTLETSLTTIALSYFPWHGEGIAYLWPAALCCFLRPTAILTWFPLAVYHLRKSKISCLELILKKFSVISFIVAAICIGIDSRMHGRFLVTPYEFLKYNVYNNIASFYGSHPWYWYFTVGLPTVLGINFLPFIFATMETVRHREIYPLRKCLLLITLLSLCTLSAVEHKEFRFISALLPLCLYITADFLTRWSYKASKLSIWLISGIIVFGNALPAWYLSTVHQKGQLEVMNKLHHISKEYRDERNLTASIYFLMPCHSTPYYSHIHQNVTMRFLTCEPNLRAHNIYKDEAMEFFESPIKWLDSHIPLHPRTAKPSHVVMYEPLSKQINDFLRHYKLLYKIPIADINQFNTQSVLKKLPSILTKQLNLDSLLQSVQPRAANYILVFQRLREEEENEFNGDFQSSKEKLKLPKLDRSNEDII